MNELGHNVQQKSAILPATITATTNGLAIDMQGYESIAFLIAVGAFVDFTGTNKWTFSVEEGDASDSSDMAAIAAADYILSKRVDGSTWDRICDAATDDDESYLIAVKASLKRYRRLVLTEGGTVSAIGGAVAILGHPRHAPAGETQKP